MKKILYIITPVIALGFGAMAFVPARAYATGSTNTCTVSSVGKKNTANQADSRFKLNGNKVTATFEVKGNADCKQDVVLASWQAPDGDKGRPYELQKLYKYVSGTFGVGKHTLTVELPDCFYQVDLARGKNPTGPNGSAVYEQGRLMGSLHGGTKVCEEPKQPEEPKTPETPETPTPETPAPAPEMPATGAGSLLGVFAGSSILGAGAHHLIAKRRARRD